MNALSNAAMTFVAARMLSPEGFGRFALLLTAVVICVGASRALTSEPYTVLTGDLDPGPAQSWIGPALGAALVLGLVVGIPTIGIGSALGAGDVVAFGCAMVAVIGQDCVRYLLVARGRVRSAFVNDALWFLVQFSLTGLAIWSGQATAAVIALCWAAGALAGLLFGLLQLRSLPRVHRVGSWVRHTKNYSGYYLLEFAALAGSGYSIVYVVAATSGLAQAGAYRGAQALYGPVTSLIGGLRLVALPALVQLRPQGKPAIMRAATLVGGLLGGISLAVMLLLWFTDSWIGPLLLGATAVGALPLIVPMGLGRAASSASAGALLGMRVLGATRASLGTRVVLSLVTVLAAWVGAVLNGALGAVWGFGVASALACGVWYLMMIRQPLRLGGKNSWSGSQGAQ